VTEGVFKETIYTDFLTVGHIPVYQEIKNRPKLKDFINLKLKDYNITNVTMNIVMF